MTEIRFYHLLKTPLERALPKMLERCLEREQRALVLVGSPERLEVLDAHLWTYNDRAFLPHGTSRDGFPADQPVWLSLAPENVNGAQVLFLCDGAMVEAPDGFDLVALLFEGRDQDAVATARGYWRDWRDRGYGLTYWQQTEKGWEQKAGTG